MSSALDGKVIIVTGGTRGMGEATVRLIVEEGGKVVFGGRDSDRGQAIASELGESVRYVRHDTASEADWIAIVETAVQTFGRVDGLVNNAGMMGRNPIAETDLALVSELVATNQTAILIGMKHAVPEMRKGGGGSIVNVGSICSTRGMALVSAYSGTKSAVSGITRAAAAELGADGIRVNSVNPGHITTKMYHDNVPAELHETHAQDLPLQRLGQPSEIAAPVVFLLSDASSYVTGVQLAVDGGLAL